jgi:L-malate glycosyltransferase
MSDGHSHQQGTSEGAIQRMRICMIADANSIHTARWVEPIVERGHEVTLVSFTPVQRPPTVTQIIDLTTRFNLPKLRLLGWGLWLRCYLHRLRPDLLHGHHLAGAIIGGLTSFRPLVISTWGSELLVEPNRTALRKVLVRWALMRGTRVTVPSGIMARHAELLGVPKPKLFEIPWGIETDIFQSAPDDRAATRNRLGLPLDAPVILCPRGIASVYNHDITLTAVDRLRHLVRDLRVVFLRYNVEEPCLRQMQRLVARFQLEGVIHWLDAQDGPESMARLYRMADGVISVPSSEGYGFTVYEAMACGCPTIITDLPIFTPELINRVHTVKVPVRDAAALAIATQDVLTNARLRQALRDNGLWLARNMGTQHRIEQTLDLYRSVIQGAMHA